MPKFETNCPCLGINRLEFSKNIVMFEITTLKFVYLQKFREKIKMPNFWNKSALYGYFWARIS